MNAVAWKMRCKCSAAHPGGSLTGEPLMNSWRTEDLMILAVCRMLQPWRQATQTRPLAGLEPTDRSAVRFVRIGSSDACKVCSQLGTAHLRIVGNCVGVAAGVPRGITTGRCTGLWKAQNPSQPLPERRPNEVQHNLAVRIGCAQTHSYSWRFRDAVEPAFARFHYSNRSGGFIRSSHGRRK